MGNLINYINEYGNIDFNNKKVNDIDVLLFSQIPVWNFKNILFKYKDEIKLSFFGNQQKEKTLINLRIYIKEHIKLWKVCVIVKDTKTFL